MTKKGWKGEGLKGWTDTEGTEDTEDAEGLSRVRN
jgi:hypothetical protein